jgi:(2Fe-2S) ferredoxin
MGYYEKHIFVCENERDPNHALKSCGRHGAKDIAEALKKRCREAELVGKVRVNKAGCLGQCQKGPVVVVYPEGVWHENVTVEDVDGIVASLKTESSSGS